jgi:hypothetical protein
MRLDLRRSERVHAQLPVVVQVKLRGETTFADPTRAIVLRTHGCLLTLSASVTMGEQLILRSVANRQEQDCRVVYLGENQDSRRGSRLRLRAAAPKVGGLENPPRIGSSPHLQVFPAKSKRNSGRYVRHLFLSAGFVRTE